MMSAFLAGVMVVVANGEVSGPSKAPGATEFLKRAILDGLAEDGVPPALARVLAKNPDFLGKCPICGPTQDALAKYGQLTIQPAAREGKGLPNDLMHRLESAKTEVRHAALRELVQRYIEREYTRLELTAEERAKLHNQFEKMRKSGMHGLRPGQKFCPSCDGATCRTPKLTD